MILMKMTMNDILMMNTMSSPKKSSSTVTSLSLLLSHVFSAVVSACPKKKNSKLSSLSLLSAEIKICLSSFLPFLCLYEKLFVLCF